MNENWNKKISALEEAAAAGDLDAKARLAGALLYGAVEFSEENAKRGYQLLQEAVEEGNDIAKEIMEKFEAELKSYHANLHTWILTMQGAQAESLGDGVTAVKFYKAASDQGCLQATSFLGNVYYNGLNGIPQNYTKAVECFKMAAEAGNMTAQSMFGLCYSQGTGIGQNYEEAEKWFLKAIAQGDVPSLNCLGDIYTYQSKYAQAEEMYKKTIESPDATKELVCSAKSCLGHLYVTKKEPSKAIPLLEEAAQEQDAVAEYVLGCCYQDGLGVEKNLEIAIDWFHRSLLHGFPEAQKEINDLQNELNRSARTPTGKNGGCYIATAVYGSYDCPQVCVLRRFRDVVLEQYLPGRLFIKIYYAISPTLVTCFGGQKWFTDFCRKHLDKLVELLDRKGFSNAPYNDFEHQK